MFGYNRVIKLLILGGSNNTSCMVILRDFPYNSALFRLDIVQISLLINSLPPASASHRPTSVGSVQRRFRSGPETHESRKDTLEKKHAGESGGEFFRVENGGGTVPGYVDSAAKN